MEHLRRDSADMPSMLPRPTPLVLRQVRAFAKSRGKTCVGHVWDIFGMDQGMGRTKVAGAVKVPPEEQ